METTLDDKLRTVATFMGLERVPVYTKGLPGNPDSLGWQDLKTLGPKTKTALNYHTDYNRLMGAWHRWNGHEVLVWVSIGMAKHDMGFSEFENRTKKVGQCILHKPIGEAFDALYEAIVWYNSLNK